MLNNQITTHVGKCYTNDVTYKSMSTQYLNTIYDPVLGLFLVSVPISRLVWNSWKTNHIVPSPQPLQTNTKLRSYGVYRNYRILPERLNWDNQGFDKITKLARNTKTKIANFLREVMHSSVLQIKIRDVMEARKSSSVFPANHLTINYLNPNLRWWR